jgi:hypothetical protein
MAKTRKCSICEEPLPPGSAGPCDDFQACAARALERTSQAEFDKYPWMRGLMEKAARGEKLTTHVVPGEPK